MLIGRTHDAVLAVRTHFAAAMLSLRVIEPAGRHFQGAESVIGIGCAMLGGYVGDRDQTAPESFGATIQLMGLVGTSLVDMIKVLSPEVVGQSRA